MVDGGRSLATCLVIHKNYRRQANMPKTGGTACVSVCVYRIFTRRGYEHLHINKFQRRRRTGGTQWAAEQARICHVLQYTILYTLYARSLSMTYIIIYCKRYTHICTQIVCIYESINAQT